jgi:hypothetical protein
MSSSPFNGESAAALLGFNEEAESYCRGISDGDAHQYAIDYATMLCNRAKGMAIETRPRFFRLFQPNRNLIKGTLDGMYRKYFLK